ncbi:hypothetical protein JCM10908_002793 [Rhodotorula pacifica]|uniref:uncharacterized protein n=1 Tax=Rhodotorula pacifica TaxID=1495444 RepID=UPI00317C9B08
MLPPYVTYTLHIIRVIGPSRSSLSLFSLAEDWRLATNGRLNPSKTEALPIGALAKADPVAYTVRWSAEEGYATWAGFPLTAGVPPASFHALVVAKIKKRLDALGGLYTSRRARALIANIHGLSRSLHLLSFSPAPPAALRNLRQILLDYVWGSQTARHAVKADYVFLPTSQGGLGLLDPVTFDTANSLRFLDQALTNPSVMWYDLAIASYSRLTASAAATTLPEGTSTPEATLWTILRSTKTLSDFSSSTHLFWRSIAAAGRAYPPAVNITHLSTSSILSLPPALFSSAPSLRSVKSLAHLYYQSAPGAGLPPGLYSLPLSDPNHANNKSGLRLARHTWLTHVLSVPLLQYLLPISALPLQFPQPSSPAPHAFLILGLCHGYSAADARRTIALRAEPCHLSSRFASYLPGLLAASVRERVWRWICDPPATPREADSHWLILHGALLTRRRLFKMNLADADLCVICSANRVDSLEHALFECTHSAAFWTAYTALLSAHVSPAFTSFTMAPGELLLGVPTLDALSPAKSRPLLRAMVGIGFQTVIDERWARLRAENPTSSSRSAEELASCAFTALAARLE